ncbi:hypothetical protein AMQ68_20920 [Chryseobacterium sp. ERMR1:04]|nr:hypothetical protein AMQ68_20920 [Chryseobacterium sp. ERMR1:04]
MMKSDSCPNCENSFDFSRDDVYLKTTLSIEGKKYRIYHFKKLCSNCNKLLVMNIGKPGEDNGKWITEKQKDN